MQSMQGQKENINKVKINISIFVTYISNINVCCVISI